MVDNLPHSIRQSVPEELGQQSNRSSDDSMLKTLQNSYCELSWIQHELAVTTDKHEMPEHVSQLMKEIQDAAENLLKTMEVCEEVLTKEAQKVTHKQPSHQAQLVQFCSLPKHLIKALARFESEMHS